ncbi:hypothetical protein Tco_1544858, partial [Tanacetum coccineum]
SDAYCFSDEEVIDFVDFFHEGEENVVIKNITTNDPFLTKLCSNHGHLRGFINEPIPNSDDVHMEDPDSSTLEPKHKVQKGVAGGYQLWYEKNDWRQLLVFCSRDVTTADPFITLLKMKAVIREKFLINVSLGQCKRAKQRALFDFEGGLIDHYGRLWDYRQMGGKLIAEGLLG